MTANLSEEVRQPVRVPTTIPQDWTWAHLVDICRPRQWPTVSKDELLPDGYIVFGANGPIGFYSEYTHTERTIAITCRGATCGTVNVVPPMSYITGNAMALDDLDERRGSLEYLYPALVYRGFSDVISGSAQPQITRQGLSSVLIPLPPLPEQRKIAAILSSVDEAIECTQAVIDQLQVVKKAMMAELLTRGLPGRHTRFKQTEIGEVPDGWGTTTVGELGDFTGGNGFRPPDWSTAGLPIIRIQNLNGSPEFNYYSGRPDPSWLVEPGELLFAWAGSRGASFGPCIWPGPRGVLNQHIHRIVPKSRVRKKYLYYVLRQLTEAIERKAHGFKDTLVHLRKAELTGWPVALPPLTEQDEIVASVIAAEERLRAEELALEALRGTKSALMSVLLTGEVRVKPDKDHQ